MSEGSWWNYSPKVVNRKASQHFAQIESILKKYRENLDKNIAIQSSLRRYLSGKEREESNNRTVVW
jgi:hypothetical protein